MAKNEVMRVTQPEDLRYMVPKIWSGKKKGKKK